MKTLLHKKHPPQATGGAGMGIIRAIFLITVAMAGCGTYAANSVKIEIIGTASGGSCEISLGSGGGSTDYAGSISGNTSLISSKTYEMTITGDYTQATINLIAPYSYTIYINGSPRKQITPHASLIGVEIYTVEVRYNYGNAPTPGTSTGLAVGDISWGVSLGRQFNGSLAGSLVIPKAVLNDALFDRCSLNYHGINEQVGVVRDFYGRIRQIIAPEVFVDVYDLTSGDGYRIDMYAPSARGASQTQPYPIVDGCVPYMSFEVRRETGNILKVRRIAGGTVQDTDAWESDNGWVKTLHGELVTEETVEGKDADLNITETITLKNHDGTIAEVTRKTYKTCPWNSGGTPEDSTLVKVEKNPDGIGGQPPQIKEYQYHENGREMGSYQKIKSIKYPNGNWVYYEYYNDGNKRGRVHREYRPWQSSPASIPAAPSAANGRVVEYDYTDDWDGAATLVSSRKETINGTVVSESSAVAQVNQDYTPKAGGPALKLWTYVNKTKFNNNPSDDVETVTVGFQPNQADAQSIYNNLVHSVTNKANGNKTSYGYIRGTWTIDQVTQTGSFSESATGTALKEITLAGTIKTPDGYVSISSIDGIDMDDLNLVPLRATKTVRIRDQGRIRREETHVFTGGSSFELLAWTNYAYTESGHLASRESSNGAAYHADWLDEFRYAETTEIGQQISYTPDALQRVSRRVVDGVNGTMEYDAQASLATDYTYDAAGRITKTRVSPATGASGGMGMEENTVYDYAGRAVSRTSANGYTSSFTESADGLTTTHILACGGERIVEKHLDGSTKSVTGTADIHQSYEIAIDNEGNQTTMITYGSGGAIMRTTTVTDRFGRVVHQSSPGPDSDHDLETTNTYGDEGQLIKVTQSGVASVLYEYDALGVLIRGGLSVTGNATLNIAAQDRVSETAMAYYKDDVGHWWLRQVNSAYTTDSSGSGQNTIAAKKATTETRVRVTGFSNNLRSEQVSIDAHGNKATTRVTVDPNSRLFTQTVAIPAKSGIQTSTQISYNGRLVKVVSALDEIVTYHYDSLGRLVLTKPPHTAAIRTKYVTRNGLETMQVSETYYENAGMTVAYIAGYEYDDAGRVCKIIDAAGAEIKRRYNCRGELTHQWGTGTNPVCYDYDGLGRVTKQYTYRNLTNADNESDTWVGDSGGDVTLFDYYPGTIYPLSRTNPKPDALGNAATITYTYDKYGRLTTQTNARGDNIKYEYYEKTGELKKRIYRVPSFLVSSGSITETYTYTRAGALASVTDLTGTRTFAYDESLGIALKTETLPSFYNGSGNASRQLAYTYETGSETGGGIPGRLAAYTLNRMVSSAAVAEHETVFSFTNDGRIDTITGNPHLTGQSARDFDYEYRAVAPGMMSGMTVNTGMREIRRLLDYDPQRALLASIETSTVLADSTGTPVVHSRHDYTHDARGFRETSLQTGAFFADYDGSPPGESNAGATFMHYAYNLRGELIDARQYMGADVNSMTRPLPGRHWQYAFDSMGNRTEANGEEYIINARNQIGTKENNSRHISGLGVPGAKVYAQVPAPGFAVSATSEGRFWSTEVVLGNAESAVKEGVTLWFGKKEAAANNADLFAKIDHTDDPNLAVFMPVSPEIMDYDADGNLVEDGLWRYTYDALNQLVAMETKDAITHNTLASMSQGVASRRIEFAYDYLGRRVAKVVKDYDTQQVIRSHRYLYQGWNVIAEYEVPGSSGILDSGALSSAPARTFYWGLDIVGTLTQSGGVGALLMIQDGNNQYYPAYDGNGNITGLLDNSGNAAAKYEYSPFGELLRREGGYAKDNPFQWSTKWTDRETSLVYYGLRYYSPMSGRFINQDPIGEQGGLNLYGFVLNNPVNFVDVLGNACYSYREIIEERYEDSMGNVYNEYIKITQVCFNDMGAFNYSSFFGSSGGGFVSGGGGGSSGTGGNSNEVIMMDKYVVTANRGKDPFAYPNNAGPLDSIIKDMERQKLCHDLRARRIKLTGEYNQFERTVAELEGRKPNSLNFGSSVLAGGNGLLVAANSTNILPSQTVTASIDHFDFTKTSSSSTKISLAGKAGAGLTGVGVAIDTYNAIDNFHEGNYAKGIQYSITSGVGMAVLRGTVVRAGTASAIGSPIFGAAVGVVSIAGDIGGTIYANSIISESYSALHKTTVTAARSHLNIIKSIELEMLENNCN